MVLLQSGFRFLAGFLLLATAGLFAGDVLADPGGGESPGCSGCAKIIAQNTFSAANRLGVIASFDRRPTSGSASLEWDYSDEALRQARAEFNKEIMTVADANPALCPKMCFKNGEPTFEIPFDLGLEKGKATWSVVPPEERKDKLLNKIALRVVEPDMVPAAQQGLPSPKTEQATATIPNPAKPYYHNIALRLMDTFKAGAMKGIQKIATGVFVPKITVTDNPDNPGRTSDVTIEPATGSENFTPFVVEMQNCTTTSVQGNSCKTACSYVQGSIGSIAGVSALQTNCCAFARSNPGRLCNIQTDTGSTTQTPQQMTQNMSQNLDMFGEQMQEKGVRSAGEALASLAQRLSANHAGSTLGNSMAGIHAAMNIQDRNAFDRRAATVTGDRQRRINLRSSTAGQLPREVRMGRFNARPGPLSPAHRLGRLTWDSLQLTAMVLVGECSRRRIPYLRRDVEQTYCGGGRAYNDAGPVKSLSAAGGSDISRMANTFVGGEIQIPKKSCRDQLAEAYNAGESTQYRAAFDCAGGGSAAADSIIKEAHAAPPGPGVAGMEVVNNCLLRVAYNARYNDTEDKDAPSVPGTAFDTMMRETDEVAPKCAQNDAALNRVGSFGSGSGAAAIQKPGQAFAQGGGADCGDREPEERERCELQTQAFRNMQRICQAESCRGNRAQNLPKYPKELEAFFEWENNTQVAEDGTVIKKARAAPNTGVPSAAVIDMFVAYYDLTAAAAIRNRMGSKDEPTGENKGSVNYDQATEQAYAQVAEAILDNDMMLRQLLRENPLPIDPPSIAYLTKEPLEVVQARWDKIYKNNPKLLAEAMKTAGPPLKQFRQVAKAPEAAPGTVQATLTVNGQAVPVTLNISVPANAVPAQPAMTPVSLPAGTSASVPAEGKPEAKVEAPPKPQAAADPLREITHGIKTVIAQSSEAIQSLLTRAVQ